MTPIEVLLFDRIHHAEGGAFTRKTMQERGVGGSELEMMQVAHALAARGYRVAIANGRIDVVEEGGVLYVPNSRPWEYIPTRALYLQRMSAPESPLAIGHEVRIVVRANDIYCQPYDVHRPLLESGRAALVANTKWQADGFTYAKEKIVIAPMLDESPVAIWPDRKGFATTEAIALPGTEGSTAVYKTPGLFVYASGPMKGLEATLAMWRKLHKLHGKVLKKAKLVIVSPGWGDFPTLSPSDKAIGVRFEGVPTPAKYREWIAKAEGLFFVNTMTEAFCCSAALAERSGTRTHILCKNGLGGIPEAIVNHTLLTEYETQFIEKFMEAWQSDERREQWYARSVPNRRPEALVEAWIDALRLPRDVRPVSSTALAASTSKVGRHAGHYLNTLLPEAVQKGPWGTAQRYWVHDRILVGGSIIDVEDADKLRQLGITHVLSAEHERDDAGKWPDDRRARFEWPDDGADIPEATLHKVMQYASDVLSQQDAILYAHCQMGGSRGPTLGYIALRWALKMSPGEAMRAILAGWAGDNQKPNASWTPHLRYIRSVERAIATMPAADGSRLAITSESTPLVDARVLDAYRETQKYSYVAEQIIDKEALYATFRQNIAAIGATVSESDASGTWRERCAKISERATNDMGQFLSWTEDLYITGLPRNEVVAYDALRRSSQWSSRWEPLTRKGAHGGARSSLLDDGATSVTIQHAHHLKVFEETTGQRLHDCDVIVEVGGGFGNFARMLRADGFSGTHVIIDLPHVREFARLFLSLNGVPVSSTPELRSGVCLLTTDDLEAMLSMVAGKRVGFVATWSLSEAPMAVRNRLFPALHKDCVSYLIASQWDHQWEGIDNRDYFASFMRESGARWQLMPVPGDAEERYLLGARGVQHAPGATLMQMLEKAVREKLGEDLGSFEQLLAEDRIVFRKSDLQVYPPRVPSRSDGRPTVGLLLICKGDEGATIIARAIVSAMKVVDAVTVVADGGPKTVAVCQALGADVYLRKTPEMNWDTGVGLFAAARNEAMSIAEKKTDYVLMLDPDDYYEGTLPDRLDRDLYEVFVHDGSLRYPRAQLFKSTKSFRYTGIIHEHVVAQSATIGRIDSLKYVRSHGGHQDREPPTIKYARHARWLERWLIEHPDDARAQFYLAQSYRDAQQFDKAIAAYERRIEMSGFEEERAFSAVQIARIMRDTGKDPTAAYLRGYEMRPTRAEPLCELACWLRDEKQKRFSLAAVVARQAASLPLPTGDYLFIEPAVYEYKALEELAIALYWSGNKAGSRDCYKQLLTRVPDGYRAHIQGMLAMVLRELAQVEAAAAQ